MVEFVSKMNLKVSSDKIFAIDMEPPVSIENGNTKFSSYADYVFIDNINGSEKADSAAMEVTITDKTGQDLIGKGLDSGSLKVIMAEDNQIRIITADMDTRVTYSKMALEAPLFKSLPNLKGVNGFTKEETELLITDIENLPKPLTSNLKTIRLLSEEQINKVFEADDLTLRFSIGGCAGSNGDIYLERGTFNGGYGILPHELTHLYMRETQLNNPETAKLQNEMDAALTELYNLQSAEGIGYGAGASPEYEELRKKVEDLKKKSEDSLPREAIIKEWLSTSNWERDVIKKGCRTGYCSDQIGNNPEGHVVWKDTGSNEPRYGVYRPYSCINCEEDLATFVQASYTEPEQLSSLVNCPPPNTYAKKLVILKKYGLIDTKTYSSVVPEKARACMGVDVKGGSA